MKPATGVPWVRLVREPGRIYGLAAKPVRDGEGVATFLRHRIGDQETEAFVVIMLDGKNRPLACHEVSRGTMNAALVHPREVFRPAIMIGAAAVILAHNHPSGEVAPSAEDVAITARLRQVGELVGIRVLDHVVIGTGTGKFHSMAEGAASWIGN